MNSQILYIRRNGPYSRRYKVVRYADGNVGVYAFSVRRGWFVVRVFQRHPWSAAPVALTPVLAYVRSRFG